MRPKSMVLIVIALVCGLVASIGISQVVERQKGTEEPAVQTSPIYIAMNDIPIGEEMGANNIKLEEWPVDKIPEGAVTDAAMLENMSPKQPLFSGEPILSAKLADHNSLKTSSDRIKKGYRVMSVKVSMDSAVSGLISPGDRVDVVVFVRGRTLNEARSGVILTNTEVFAIDDRITREVDTDGTGGSTQAKTVSLLVTPEQGSKLMLFSQLGKLSLSLRRFDDDDVAVMDTSDIVGFGRPLGEPEPTPPIEEEPEPSDEYADAAYTMEVIEGGEGGDRRYHWNDPNELPLELQAESGKGNKAEPTGRGPSPFPPAPESESADESPPESLEGGEPIVPGDANEIGSLKNSGSLSNPLIQVSRRLIQGWAS